jgi:predicted site-specific integrase-resolvase
MAVREWLKVRELATREGVSARTIRLWEAKGLIEIRRLAPRTGVRARLRRDEELAAVTTPLPPRRRPLR